MASKLSEISENNSSVNMEHLEKLINEKFKTTNVKLDGINTRLDRINGSVQKHEKRIGEIEIERAKANQEKKDIMATRAETCPQDYRIDKLEKESYNTKMMKRYNARLFAVSTAVIGVLISLLHFVFN